MRNNPQILNDLIVSYSQNYEDIAIWRALSHIENGFYVDVGANDPFIDSVTQLFYQQNWRGINIEPLEDSFQLLKKNRPLDINLQVAISNSPSEKKFYQVIAPGGTGLSTLDSNLATLYDEKSYKVIEYLVPVKTLNQIFSDYSVQEIHFLKIDIEGLEKEALEGLSLEIYRPWIIVIESIHPVTLTESYGAWEPILLKNNYQFVFFDGINRFYVAQERNQIINSLNYLINDDFYVKYKILTDVNYDSNYDSNLIINSQLAQIEELKQTLGKIYTSRSWKVAKNLRIIFCKIKLTYNIIKNNIVQIYSFFVSIINLLTDLIFSFIRLFKNTFFFRKLLGYIKSKYPVLYADLKDKYNKPYNLPLLRTFIKKHPILLYLSKKVCYQFPTIAKYLLKVIKKIDSKNLMIKFSFNEKSVPENFKNKVNLFLDELKLEIEANRNNKDEPSN